MTTGDYKGDKEHHKPYNAVGSGVEKEAEEKKHGGSVHHGGHKSKHVHMEAHVHGKKHGGRLDKRPRKASGGGVGADKNPFSSARQGSKRG